MDDLLHDLWTFECELRTARDIGAINVHSVEWQDVPELMRAMKSVKDELRRAGFRDEEDQQDAPAPASGSQI